MAIIGIIVVVLMHYNAQRLYGYGEGNLVGVVELNHEE
jgi:hypothetical protein